MPLPATMDRVWFMAPGNVIKRHSLLENFEPEKLNSIGLGEPVKPDLIASLMLVLPQSENLK